MRSVLLAVIYLTFISLGLPDSVTGSAWPIIHTDLSCDVSAAGFINMTVTAGTIISSLFSQHIIRRFRTAKVCAASILLTAVSLIGYSISGSLFFMLLCSIPLGLGGGCVDAAINHYVSRHFSAGKMSFLHCFWGVGTLVSPLMLSYIFSHGGTWRFAYRINSALQIAIMLSVILASPLFLRLERDDSGIIGTEEETEVFSLREIWGVRGAKHALFAYALYCGLETTIALWVASYAVFARGLSPSEAALVTSMVYLGITIGRLISGFVSDRTSDRVLIKAGHLLTLVSMLALPFASSPHIIMATVLLIGIGLGPVYPTMMHQSVNYYEKRYGQAIIGFQMAFAYIGATLLPPLFGILSKGLSLNVLPYYMIILFLLHALAVSLKNRCAGKRAYISNRSI